MKEALRESEEWFRSVWECSADGMRLCDASGKIVSVNTAYSSMVGKSVEELKGKSFAEAYSTADSERILQGFTKNVAARTIEPYFEKELTLRKGDKRWFAVSNAFLNSQDGSTCVLSIFRDITARKQADAALQESEGRYRALIDWTPDAITLHRDGKLLYVNPAAIKMFGATSAQDLVGRPVLDLIHPDFHQSQLERVRRIAAHEYVTPMVEVKFLKLDGTSFDAEVQGTSIIYNGAPAIHATMRDITERKFLEMERDNERMVLEMIAQRGPLPDILTRVVLSYESLFPGMRGSMLLPDAEGRHLWHVAAPSLSQAYYHAIDGVEIGAGVGSCGTAAFTGRACMVADIAHDPLWKDCKDLALAHGLRACWSVPIPGAVGRVLGTLAFYFSTPRAASPSELATIERGAHLASLAIERQIAVAALQDSEKRYRALVEWSPEAIGVQRGGRLLYVNPAAIKLFGATDAQQLIDKPIHELIHPDFHQFALARMKEMVDHGVDTPKAEMRFIKVDGTIIDVEVHGTSIIYDGTPAIHTVVRDITGHKQVEAARALLEVQLRESQKMEAIGTLAGGIAHDFNNILATILGNVELARQDVSTQPQALESLEEIRKAGSRASDLVQQILSFSRRQPTERKRTALAPVVEESARLLRATLPARVALEVHCEADVPAVLADATQIEQVLINLSTNAMQAMTGRSGCIGIRLDTVMLDIALAETHPALRALHARHPGRTVRLAVSDNGVGMDAATIARIFEPFFTTKPVDEGTGLGLSVVLGIVQAHEGAITVDSLPSQGATFTVYLPAVEVQSGAPAPDAGAAATAPAPGVAGGRHILYLDDDEALVFLVTRMLARRGHRISGHTNQREALDALRADPASFDLVVTDYNMPGMSGLDVAREVRTIRADLPVAVASGFIDETLRAQVAGAGVRELIFKANAVEDMCDAFERLAQTVGEKSKGG